ncbi:hypothetical protein Leryth_011797 [Lithospermum erythrorhizon]|nr:hypothetical protein Leryth_011797 [Lithospermum erythrorhizon]
MQVLLIVWHSGHKIDGDLGRGCYEIALDIGNVVEICPGLRKVCLTSGRSENCLNHHCVLALKQWTEFLLPNVPRLYPAVVGFFLPFRFLSLYMR